MRLLLYKNLDTRRVKAAFTKVRVAIETGDFRSADVKKLTPTPYWRAKLDYTNRLLLQFARHGDETVCLALEVIENHAYEKSRFLRGTHVDETKIEHAPLVADPATTDDSKIADTVPLRWMHPSRAEFELLDKPIVFDDAQEAVRRLPVPVVVVGSAGSGKTAVTLAKLRETEGRVLYVTQSAYLAQSARALYAAHGYENPAQEVEFLSYREFVETLRVPAGREVTFSAFRDWFERHRQTVRSTLGDFDAHAVFEEFRGVLSASAQGPLDLSTYLDLGPRQSLLAAGAREAAHALFARYRQWLRESDLFDLNLVAHEWRPLAAPAYDFIVIDEVQDLTNVQLALVLACLKKPGQFLLCGDANQIVHPNFFSWAAVRTLFWHGLAGDAAQHQALSVLQANFRNTRAVTDLANTLLKIKQARFGSIDRESNFLVESASSQDGQVQLLPARAATLRELDTQTRASVQHAVIVLRDEDKPSAREHFRTPLVFSVHEAKGLEYPHVILYALVSDQRAAYAEVCDGVTLADLQIDELTYRRAHDKGDKSLELYKFYVNALYVAMTRAVESLVLVESDTQHPLLGLLGLKVAEASSAAPGQTSSRDEWAQEARKLELQGKNEQAHAIRETFLQVKPMPWVPWSEATMRDYLPRALNRMQPSNKPRQALLDYALWHGQHAWVEQLAIQAQFAPARRLVPGGSFAWPALVQNFRCVQEQAWRDVALLRQRHLQPYVTRNFKQLLRTCDLYGVDHRTPTGSTPLMMASRAGNLSLVDALLARGANPLLEDEFGHTPWFFALNRAMEDPEYARQSIAPLFERIAPPVLDVQTDERLVRLEHHQGEYWILSLMLAGLKTQRTQCVRRPCRTVQIRQGVLCRWAQRNPHLFARAPLENNTIQTHLREQRARARRGPQRLSAGASPVGTNRQRPLPAQPEIAVARPCPRRYARMAPGVRRVESGVGGCRHCRSGRLERATEGLRGCVFDLTEFGATPAYTPCSRRGPSERIKRMPTTKLWIMSDLHLESVPYPEAFRPARPDFDVLVAAGDIWEGDCQRAFHFLARLANGKPVVFVMGNHEHWNGGLRTALAQAKTIARACGVTLLDGSAATIAGCRFIGTTLWTDYRLTGEAVEPDAPTGERIVIAWDGARRLITVDDAIALHATARNGLETLMADTEAARTDNALPLVVVTHHAPHPGCLPDAARKTWAAGNSASDLSHLTDSGRAVLWIHGHLHHSVDMTRPNGTRILCNPAGPMFSNPAFNERLVVEVGA